MLRTDKAERLNALDLNLLGVEYAPLALSLDNTFKFASNFKHESVFSNGDDYAADTSTTGKISDGSTIAASFDFSGDEDWFKIDLTAGEEAIFNTSVFVEAMSIYDASGTRLSRIQGFEVDFFNYTPTQTGTYYIGVEGETNQSGFYTLSFGDQPDDYAGDLSTWGYAQPGYTTMGTFDFSGDTDWFEFRLGDNESTKFEAFNSPQSLAIYDASGQLLTGGAGATSVEISSTDSATYYLGITGNSIGDYFLYSSPVDSEFAGDTTTSGTIRLGNSHASQFDFAGDADWFAINLTGGEDYYLNSNATQISSFYIADSSGNNISGANSSQNLFFTAPYSGEFYVAIEGNPQSVYTIYSSDVPEDIAGDASTAATIIPGLQVSGFIDAANDEDWFEVNVVNGQVINFRAFGILLDNLSLRLLDSTGMQVAESNSQNGDPEIEYTFSAAGTYYVSVQAVGASTFGSYFMNTNAISTPGETFEGTSNDDVLTGTVGDDVMNGYDGDDEFITLDGNNTVNGGAGFDVVSYAGMTVGQSIFINNDGLSLIRRTTGTDTLDSIEGIIATDFDDNFRVSIFSTFADDVYYDGAAGNDYLQGGRGDDTLIGGDGDDILRSNRGAEVIDGGNGFDRISFFNADALEGVIADLRIQITLNDGFGNTETFTSIEGLGGGTVFRDEYYGNDDNNFFITSGVGDIINGYGGDDEFFLDGAGNYDGGTGTDTITQFGDLLVFGLTSGGFFRRIDRSEGVNVNLQSEKIIDDGYGNSGLVISFENLGGSDFDDILIGSQSANILNGFLGNDELRAGNGDDILNGDAGDDVLSGQNGNDTVDGGDGNDTAFGGSGDDILSGDAGDDMINGNSGDDELSGGADDDLIIGGGGNDTVNGDAGNDSLSGQGGNDVLNGGIGDDTILGGSGLDIISGGDGADDINAGGGNDTVNGDAGNDVINAGGGADMVMGGDGDDALFGNNQNDTIFGELGIDTISGGAGNDTLDGGEGNDIISGDGSKDTLFGDDGDDMLFGGSGGDTLDGGRGADTLEGGGGNDTLTGGLGADVFVQASGFRADRITDFEDGIDLIDFSGNTTVNDFAKVMNSAFQQGTTVRIELNPNNILVLENFNLTDLDASDFTF